MGKLPTSLRAFELRKLLSVSSAVAESDVGAGNTLRKTLPVTSWRGSCAMTGVYGEEYL